MPTYVGIGQPLEAAQPGTFNGTSIFGPPALLCRCLAGQMSDRWFTINDARPTRRSDVVYAIRKQAGDVRWLAVGPSHRASSGNTATANLPRFDFVEGHLRKFQSYPQQQMRNTHLPIQYDTGGVTTRNSLVSDGPNAGAEIMGFTLATWLLQAPTDDVAADVRNDPNVVFIRNLAVAGLLGDMQEGVANDSFNPADQLDQIMKVRHANVAFAPDADPKVRYADTTLSTANQLWRLLNPKFVSGTDFMEISVDGIQSVADRSKYLDVVDTTPGTLDARWTVSASAVPFVIRGVNAGIPFNSNEWKRTNSANRWSVAVHSAFNGGPEAWRMPKLLNANYMTGDAMDVNMLSAIANSAITYGCNRKQPYAMQGPTVFSTFGPANMMCSQLCAMTNPMGAIPAAIHLDWPNGVATECRASTDRNKVGQNDGQWWCQWTGGGRASMRDYPNFAECGWEPILVSDARSNSGDLVPRGFNVAFNPLISVSESPFVILRAPFRDIGRWQNLGWPMFHRVMATASSHMVHVSNQRGIQPLRTPVDGWFPIVYSKGPLGEMCRKWLFGRNVFDNIVETNTMDVVNNGTNVAPINLWWTTEYLDQFGNPQSWGFQNSANQPTSPCWYVMEKLAFLPIMIPGSDVKTTPASDTAASVDFNIHNTNEITNAVVNGNTNAITHTTADIIGGPEKYPKWFPRTTNQGGGEINPWQISSGSSQLTNAITWLNTAILNACKKRTKIWDQPVCSCVNYSESGAPWSDRYQRASQFTGDDSASNLPIWDWWMPCRSTEPQSLCSASDKACANNPMYPFVPPREGYWTDKQPVYCANIINIQNQGGTLTTLLARQVLSCGGSISTPPGPTPPDPPPPPPPPTPPGPNPPTPPLPKPDPPKPDPDQKEKEKEKEKEDNKGFLEQTVFKIGDFAVPVWLLGLVCIIVLIMLVWLFWPSSGDAAPRQKQQTVIGHWRAHNRQRK